MTSKHTANSTEATSLKKKIKEEFYAIEHGLYFEVILIQ